MTSETQDRTLSVTRLIAADPATVWTAMMERQSEWFCPAPWTAEPVEQDWRPGGRDAMLFKGPDGEEMPQEGVFLEVTPGKRFVTTDAIRIDPETRAALPAEPFMIGTWEIEAEGEGTRFTATARHFTDEGREHHREMGFEQGWQAAADQLAALCEQ